jgi:hypothetical protein
VSNHVPPSAEVDLLLARISARTGALRNSGSDAAAHETERLLLDDLARVAAILRTGATALAESLDGAADRATASLQAVERDSA